MISISQSEDAFCVRIFGVTPRTLFRFVDDLKAAIHPLHREYDPYSKSWMISEDALGSLISLIHRHGASDYMIERCQSRLVSSST